MQADISGWQFARTYHFAGNISVHIVSGRRYQEDCRQQSASRLGSLVPDCSSAYRLTSCEQTSRSGCQRSQVLKRRVPTYHQERKRDEATECQNCGKCQLLRNTNTLCQGWRSESETNDAARIGSTSKKPIKAPAYLAVRCGNRGDCGISRCICNERSGLVIAAQLLEASCSRSLSKNTRPCRVIRC